MADQFAMISASGDEADEILVLEQKLEEMKRKGWTVKDVEPFNLNPNPTTSDLRYFVVASLAKRSAFNRAIFSRSACFTFSFAPRNILSCFWVFLNCSSASILRKLAM